MMRPALGLAALVLALAAARGGAAKKPDPTAELSEEQLFLHCQARFDEDELKDARTCLRRYEQRYPRGPRIVDAKLLIAETYYRSKVIEERVEGVSLFRQVISFHPQHALACVAQQRIAEYHLKQMRSCERDQSETRLAIDEFQKLLATYPDCERAPEARKQLQSAYDRLACAELKVAEYYKKTGKHEAAEHRLADLLRDFKVFTDRCAALALQIELLRKLGQPEDARQSLTRMEGECDGSPLLAEARKHVSGAPVAAEGMGSVP